MEKLLTNMHASFLKVEAPKRMPEFYCFRCHNKAFRKAKQLHNHYKRSHAEFCKVRCDVCMNYFENLSALTGHQLVAHGDEEQYYCDNCEQGFADIHGIISHNCLPK